MLDWVFGENRSEFKMIKRICEGRGDSYIRRRIQISDASFVFLFHVALRHSHNSSLRI